MGGTTNSSRARRRRFSLAVLIGGVLLGTSILGFVRVPSTVVELEIAASEVGFTVTSRHPLNYFLDVSYIGILTRSTLRIPRAKAMTDVQVYLTADSADGRSGQILIEPILIGPGTHVLLQRPKPGRLLAVLTGDVGEVSISASGPVRLKVPGSEPVIRDYARGKKLRIRPPNGEFKMEFTLPDTGQTTLSAQIPVDSLVFARRERFAGDGSPMTRQVSTVEHGSIFLESLSGEQVSLRAGQSLRLTGVEGTIRRIVTTPESTHLNFYGIVREMATGEAGARRTLKPTLLEWLAARHGWKLLWGVAAYVLALVGTAVKLWN